MSIDGIPDTPSGADAAQRIAEQTGRDEFAAAIAELQQRIATVHQVVACPRCKAGIGVRCVHVRKHRSGPLAPPPVTLKHPHGQRLRAAGIPLR